MIRNVLILLFILPLLALSQHIVDILPNSSNVGELRFWDLDVSAYEGFKADPTITSPIIYELWGALPSVTENLCMDSSGKLLFCGPGGGGAEWSDNAGADPFLQPVDGVTKAVSIGVVTELAKLAVVGDDTAQITGLFREVAAQTADIFQVQDSGGSVLFTIEPSGEIGIGNANPSALFHMTYTDGFFKIFAAHTMRWERDTVDIVGLTFDWQKTRAGSSANANDNIGLIRIRADNSAGDLVILGSIRALVDSPTAGSEEGRWDFYAAEGGSESLKLTIGPTAITFADDLLLDADSAHSVFSTSLRPTSFWSDLVNTEQLEIENAAHTGHFVFKFVDLNTELQFLDTVGAEILTLQAGINRIQFHDTLVPSGGIDIGTSGLAFATLFVNSVGSASFFPAVFANALDVNSITNSIDILLNRTMVAGTPDVTAIGSSGARFDGFFDAININTCVGCPGGGHVIQDNVTPMTQRANLNFRNAFTLTDDVGNDGTIVDITVNSTLTVGASLLEINLGNVNTWTATQTFTQGPTALTIGAGDDILPLANGTSVLGGLGLRFDAFLDDVVIDVLAVDQVITVTDVAGGIREVEFFGDSCTSGDNIAIWAGNINKRVSIGCLGTSDVDAELELIPSSGSAVKLTTVGIEGLYIGGDRVVRSRQSAITVPTCAGVDTTYGSEELTCLNELEAAIGILLVELGATAGHGLIAN